MSELESRLERFKRRVRWLHVWRGLAYGALAGAGVSLVFALLDYFRVRYFDWQWLVFPVAAGLVVGALLGWFRRVPTSAIADSIDRRASLKNRLGTANEHPAGFGEEVEADALAHLADVRPSAVFPVRITKWHAGSLAGLALAGSIFLLGNTPIFLSESERKNREELQQVGKSVERVAKPLLERKPEELSPDAKELAKKYEQFSKELEKGRIPKEEAMQKANELAREAEKLSHEQFDESDRSLAKAQKSMEDAALEKAAKEMGFDPAELTDSERSDVDRYSQMSEQERAAEGQKLASQIADLEAKLRAGKDENGKDLDSDDANALNSKLEGLKSKAKALKLSQKVKDMLERLTSHPEFKEILEMMKDLQKINQQGKNGELQNPEATEEQIREMMKKLEELADKLKDDEELSKFLKDLKEALKKAGQCSGGG